MGSIVRLNGPDNVKPSSAREPMLRAVCVVNRTGFLGGSNA